MNILFLTQVGWPLKPLAWIMGEIFNAIYNFFALFGIENIALCIIIFTLVMKMLMLPLTIKQQKFTRLSSKMSPELTKIQEKYKGKKDEESMRRQQAETQEVYAKYGTSPLGGCLPLLITLPIMFALYRVIYAIPAYVTKVGDLYTPISQAIQGIAGHADQITNFISTEGITRATTSFAEYAAGTEAYSNGIIDILANFNQANWTSFFNLSAFSGLKETFAENVDKIIDVNTLFGLSILDKPTWNSISVIIPILAVVTQFIQSKLQSVTNPKKDSKKDEDSALNSTSKTMMYIMPIMSGVFCLTFPIGVGVYWIASALFTIFQTLFINRYLDKADIDQMIEKNVEKANKKKAKLGVDYGDKMAAVAKTATKSYDTEYDSTSYKKNNKRKGASGSGYTRSSVSYSASSIAANANLLAARNSVDSASTEVSSEPKEDSPETEEGKE